MYRFDSTRSTKGEVLKALEEKYSLYESSLMTTAREIGMKIQELLRQEIIKKEIEEKNILSGVGSDSMLDIGIEYEINCKELLTEYVEFCTRKCEALWDKVEDYLYSWWVTQEARNWKVDVECFNNATVVFTFYHKRSN